ncbi:MAG TPA: aromatic acid exporter family protein, partial [Actinomycetota bacterium]|nr:aromatic acid exporter family protein [Actinomycetota bacterium]
MDQRSERGPAGGDGGRRETARHQRDSSALERIRDAWVAWTAPLHSQPSGVPVIKTTLAAVMAFLVAHRLGTSQQPLLAPLTAILVVQLTMYETVARAMQRVASVMAGVLIALAIATVVGLTWWTLGLAVGASLVCGRLLRLGPHLVEVPISAMLVLAVGDADHVAAA